MKAYALNLDMQSIHYCVLAPPQYVKLIAELAALDEN